MVSRSGAYLSTMAWSFTSSAGRSGRVAEASRRVTTRRISTRHVATRLLRSLGEEEAIVGERATTRRGSMQGTCSELRPEQREIFPGEEREMVWFLCSSALGVELFIVMGVGGEC